MSDSRMMKAGALLWDHRSWRPVSSAPSSMDLAAGTARPRSGRPGHAFSGVLVMVLLWETRARHRSAQARVRRPAEHVSAI